MTARGCRLLPVASTLFASVVFAQSGTYYEVADVPTELDGTEYAPWDVVLNDSGAYALAEEMPELAFLDALYRRGSGAWLLSVDVPAQLGGTTWEPRDVFEYDGAAYVTFLDGGAAGVPAGSDIDAAFLLGNGNLVVSFDVPTELGGVTYRPSDLVEYDPAIPAWSSFFSGETAGIPDGANVIAAGRRGALTVLGFDIPVDAGGSVAYPGDLVSWDGAALAVFDRQPEWPGLGASRVMGLGFPAGPGAVPPTLVVDKVSATQLRFDWSPSSCSGATDYAIYEGTIGNWYDHAQIDCSDDGGDLSEVVSVSPGDTFYLVVPLAGSEEGSYGTDSTGAQRPVSSSSCAAGQSLDCAP